MYLNMAYLHIGFVPGSCVTVEQFVAVKECCLIEAYTFQTRNMWSTI